MSLTGNYLGSDKSHVQEQYPNCCFMFITMKWRKSFCVSFHLGGLVLFRPVNCEHSTHNTGFMHPGVWQTEHILLFSHPLDGLSILAGEKREKKKWGFQVVAWANLNNTFGLHYFVPLV